MEKLIECTIEDIEKIVSECVKNIIDEHTNMKSLYHFTSIYSLREIVNSDELLGANYLKDYWDNNSHISLTRHRSNFEGFAGANGKNRNVRIQFNVDRLNSRHDILTIKPMEFYSPQRHGRYTFDFDNPNGSSKAYYHSPKNRDADENGIEYHNQAEEGLQIKNDKYRPKLKNIHKYIDRIDILFKEFNEVLKDYEGWNNVLSEYQEIGDSAFANYVPIFVYTNARNFVLQNKHCVKLKDMLEFLNSNYGNIKDIHGKRFEKFLGNLNDLEECTLNEHTNMKSLYHFTTLNRFSLIAESDELYSAFYNTKYWDGNSHISLTRHRSDFEGFANASYYRMHPFVRLEFNTDKLNSNHNVLNVKPMEYYSPKRDRYDAAFNRQIPGNESSKSRYQDKEYYYEKQRRMGLAPVKLGLPKELNLGSLQRHEYQNQAEEGLQLPYRDNLTHVSAYLNRVDIYYPDYDSLIMGFKLFDTDRKSLLKIAKSEFAQRVPIYFYIERSHFTLQDKNCVSIQTLADRLEGKEELNESVNSFDIWKRKFMEHAYECVNDLENEFLRRLGLSVELDYNYNFGDKNWIAVYERSKNLIGDKIIPIGVNLGLIHKLMVKNGIDTDDFNIKAQARISIGHEIAHGLVDYLIDYFDEDNGEIEEFIHDYNDGEINEEELCEEFGEYMFPEATGVYSCELARILNTIE